MRSLDLSIAGLDVFTSACGLPLCVPLLLFWLKPEVKAYYGRT